jgi:hypothetical protein
VPKVSRENGPEGSCFGDHVQILLLVRIDVVPGRTDQRASLGGVELRNRLEQRIEQNVGHPRIEKGVEALDQSIHLDAELIRARDRAMDRRVQRGRVAACGQYGNALHCGFLDADRIAFPGLPGAFRYRPFCVRSPVGSVQANLSFVAVTANAVAKLRCEEGFDTRRY